MKTIIRKVKKVDKRTLLLDVTEKLMVEEGYAAVSTRRVAGELGLAPGLVHYYFPTTDDLLLATYRRAIGKYDERLREAIASDHPVQALWSLYTGGPAALVIEFISMANHRKVIRKELARHIEYTRKLQADGLVSLPADVGLDPKIVSPLSVAMMLAGMSRAFVMEGVLGISYGHAETEALVKWLLDRLDKSRKPQTSPRPLKRRRSRPSNRRRQG